MATINNMTDWHLPTLLEKLHESIRHQLEAAREAIGHAGTKGDASEKVWVELFNSYLPKRYVAETAHIVDSNNAFSQQIDVVIYDRQYSPLIFELQDQKVIPAECVYAVFEAKQTINVEHIRYAHEKVASVRALHRTSLAVPHVEGLAPPKDPQKIFGGILTFESDWDPALGSSLERALNNSEPREGNLDLGCIANHGHFTLNEDGATYHIVQSAQSATAFLFELIARLQSSGTAPMIDIQAYARWLDD